MPELLEPKTPEEQLRAVQELHDGFRKTIKELVRTISLEAKRDKPPRNIRFNEAPIGSHMFCNYIVKDVKTKRVVSEDIFYDPSMFWDAPPGALYAVLWHEYGHGQEKHQRIERDDDVYYQQDVVTYGEGQVHATRNLKMDVILDANNRADHPGLILPYRALYEDSFPRVLKAKPQGLEDFAEATGLSEGAKAMARGLDLSARRPQSLLLALKHEGYWHQEDERLQVPEDERPPNPYLADDAVLAERFGQIRDAAREIGDLRRSTVLRSESFNRTIAPVYFAMLEKRLQEMVEQTQSMLDQGLMALPDAAELERSILDKVRETQDAEKTNREAALKALEEQAQTMDGLLKRKIQELEKEISDALARAAELENHAAEMRAQAESLSRSGSPDQAEEAERYTADGDVAAETAEDQLELASTLEQTLKELQEQSAQAGKNLRQMLEEQREKLQNDFQETENQVQIEIGAPPQTAQEAVQRILDALSRFQQSQPKKDGAEQQEVEGQGSGEEEGEKEEGGKEGQDGKEGKGGKDGKGEGKGKGKAGKGKGQGQGQGQEKGQGGGKGKSKPKGPTRITYQSSKEDGGGGWISVDKNTRTKRLEDLGRWGIDARQDQEYRRIKHMLDQEALDELVSGLVLAFNEDRQRIILADLPHGSLPTARKVEALRRRYAGEQLPAVREVRKTVERFMGVDVIVCNDHSGSMWGERENAAKAANVSIASACLRVNTEIARRMRRMGLSDREIAAAPPLRYLGLLFSNDVQRMNSRGWETPLIGSQSNMDDRDLDEEKFVVDMFGSYEQMNMGDNNDQLSAAHALHQAYGRDFPGLTKPEERVKIIYFVTDGGCDIHEMRELMLFLHGKTQVFPFWTARMLEIIEPGCSKRVEERIRKYRDQLFAVGIGIGGMREFTDVYNEGRTPNENDTRAYEDNDVVLVDDAHLGEMPKKILRLTGAKFHSPRFRALRARFAHQPVGRMIKQKVGS